MTAFGWFALVGMPLPVLALAWAGLALHGRVLGAPTGVGDAAGRRVSGGKASRCFPAELTSSRNPLPQNR